MTRRQRPARTTARLAGRSPFRALPGRRSEAARAVRRRMNSSTAASAGCIRLLALAARRE
jgi:hypothetical protein